MANFQHQESNIGKRSKIIILRYSNSLLLELLWKWAKTWACSKSFTTHSLLNLFAPAQTHGQFYLTLLQCLKLIDSPHNFCDHINQIVKKANRQLGLKNSLSEIAIHCYCCTSHQWDLFSNMVPQYRCLGKRNIYSKLSETKLVP